MRLQIEPNKDCRGKRVKDAPWKAVADGETLFACPNENSKTAAREHAEIVLVDHYCGDFAPVILNYRGTILVISRNQYGYGYRMYDLATMGWYERAGHCSTGFLSKDECLRAAVMHLAGNKREEGETTSSLFSVLRQDERTIHMEQEFSESAARLDAGYRRYREALERGMSDNDAHDYAWRNPARPELWREVA